MTKDTQRLGDMLTALQSPEMRRVLGRIMMASGYFNMSYVRGDTHGSAYNEGRRSIGYELKRMIDEADPEAVMHIHNERRNNT